MGGVWKEPAAYAKTSEKKKGGEDGSDFSAEGERRKKGEKKEKGYFHLQSLSQKKKDGEYYKDKGVGGKKKGGRSELLYTALILLTVRKGVGKRKKKRKGKDLYAARHRSKKKRQPRPLRQGAWYEKEKERKGFAELLLPRWMKEKKKKKKRGGGRTKGGNSKIDAGAGDKGGGKRRGKQRSSKIEKKRKRVNFLLLGEKEKREGKDLYTTCRMFTERRSTKRGMKPER